MADEHVGKADLAVHAADAGQDLLVGRQLGDGVRVADAGEVGVLLPVLERLPDAAVVLGVFGELGPGGEVGAEPGEGLLAEAGVPLLVELGGDE